MLKSLEKKLNSAEIRTLRFIKEMTRLDKIGNKGIGKPIGVVEMAKNARKSD